MVRNVGRKGLPHFHHFMRSFSRKKVSVYAFITSQVLKRVKQQSRIVTQVASIINLAAAYDANSGKKLWNIQTPTNNLIEDMSICNDLIYLWTNNAIYAYNANSGKPLWRKNNLILLNAARIVLQITLLCL